MHPGLEKLLVKHKNLCSNPQEIRIGTTIDQNRHVTCSRASLTISEVAELALLWVSKISIFKVSY